MSSVTLKGMWLGTLREFSQVFKLGKCGNRRLQQGPRPCPQREVELPTCTGPLSSPRGGRVWREPSTRATPLRFPPAPGSSAAVSLGRASAPGARQGQPTPAFPGGTPSPARRSSPAQAPPGFPGTEAQPRLPFPCRIIFKQLFRLWRPRQLRHFLSR